MPRMILDDAFTNPATRLIRSRWLILGGAACVLTTAVGLVSLRYGLPSRPFAAPLPNARINPVALSLHAVPAALALLIMPFQLNTRFRSRHLRAHRIIGRSYVGLVSIAGLAAIWIAPDALGGAISATGFTALGLAWVGSTWFGVIATAQRRTPTHREWMTRSSALAFSAVTLRLLIPLATKLIGIDFVVAYRVASWLCWVPNLLLAEWWLRSGGGRSPVAGRL